MKLAWELSVPPQVAANTLQDRRSIHAEGGIKPDGREFDLIFIDYIFLITFYRLLLIFVSSD
jgi:hypothetical protein